MVESQDKALVDRIPDAETVRARLTEAVREVELLRRMLRLSQQAEKYKQPKACAVREGAAA